MVLVARWDAVEGEGRRAEHHARQGPVGPPLLHLVVGALRRAHGVGGRALPAVPVGGGVLVLRLHEVGVEGEVVRHPAPAIVRGLAVQHVHDQQLFLHVEARGLGGCGHEPGIGAELQDAGRLGAGALGLECVRGRVVLPTLDRVGGPAPQEDLDAGVGAARWEVAAPLLPVLLHRPKHRRSAEIDLFERTEGPDGAGGQRQRRRPIPQHVGGVVGLAIGEGDQDLGGRVGGVEGHRVQRFVVAKALGQCAPLRVGVPVAALEDEAAREDVHRAVQYRGGDAVAGVVRVAELDQRGVVVGHELLRVEVEPRDEDGGGAFSPLRTTVALINMDPKTTTPCPYSLFPDGRTEIVVRGDLERGRGGGHRVLPGPDQVDVSTDSFQ